VHEQHSVPPPAMTLLIRRLDPAFALYLRLSQVLILGIAVLMLVVMVGANSWNMALRALWGRGVRWHQELSVLAAMWVYFAAYALNAKDDAYIRIGFFVDRLPATLRRHVYLFDALVVLAFHALMFWLTIEAMRLLSFFHTHALGISESWFFVGLLVGAADIVLTELIHLARHAAGLPSPVTPGEV
jgi:TRAP-type C4-dicarboxylate transport system permease small subunit